MDWKEPPLDDDPLLKSGAEDEAQSFNQKAKIVVRLVAGGFLLIGSLDLLLYWLKCNKEQTSLNLLHCLWLSIPLVIGVVILVKTAALAERIEDWLEQ